MRLNTDQTSSWLFVGSCRLQRMALDEREEVREHLEEIDEGQASNLDDRRMQVSCTRNRLGSIYAL